MEGGKQMFVRDVVALMVSQNKPYWWVTHYHDSKHIAESPKSDNLDLDESAFLLRELVKHLAAGRYKIQLSEQPKGTNNRGDVSHLVFTVPSQDEPAQQASVGSIPDVSSVIAGIKKEMEDRFKFELEIMKLKHEHEKQMAELKSQMLETQSTGINGFLNSEVGQGVVGALGMLVSEYLKSKLPAAAANYAQSNDVGL
jgi:hypothetical protein